METLIKGSKRPVEFDTNSCLHFLLLSYDTISILCYLFTHICKRIQLAAVLKTWNSNGEIFNKEIPFLTH